MLKKAFSISIRFILCFGVTTLLGGIIGYLVKKYRYNHKTVENWQYHTPGSLWDVMETVSVIYFIVCLVYFLVILIKGDKPFSMSRKTSLTLLVTYVVLLGFLMLWINPTKIPLIGVLPYLIVATFIPFLDNTINSLFYKQK